MNIPPYWSRMVENGCAATGWSFVSASDAERVARENARQIAARLASGGLDSRGRSYYLDRPMREPIIREFRDAEGERNAVITRNAYGCSVLNTARMLFVDVDLSPPPQQASLGSFFGRLFGKKPDPTPVPSESATLAQAEAWARSCAPWRWRVYRTKAGLRFMAVHTRFEHSNPVVQRVFDALGADPLYRKLCTVQKCFRARLTPKPWRCGHHSLSVHWPFAHAEAARAFDEWQRAYAERSQGWRTCELISEIGDATRDPALAELIATHDESTRIDAKLPLA